MRMIVAITAVAFGLSGLSEAADNAGPARRDLTVAAENDEAGGRLNRKEVIAKFDLDGNGQLSEEERLAAGQARAAVRPGGPQGENGFGVAKGKNGHGGAKGKNGFGGPKGKNGHGGAKGKNGRGARGNR